MTRFRLELLSENKLEWTINEYLYVGNDSSCGVCLSDHKMEKKHALIEVKELGLYIKDLRSFNGVFVNGA